MQVLRFLTPTTVDRITLPRLRVVGALLAVAPSPTSRAVKLLRRFAVARRRSSFLPPVIRPDSPTAEALTARRSALAGSTKTISDASVRVCGKFATLWNETGPASVSAE